MIQTGYATASGGETRKGSAVPAWTTRGGAGKVRCMPRLEEARAEERGNTRVGRLPMRSVSNAGNFQQRSFACPRIFARGRKAGIIARLSYQLPNAAFCHSEILQDIRRRNSNTVINTLLLQYRLCHLCYDGVAHEYGGRAPGREDRGWTLSRWWIR
jgi:hypothetical protein